MTSSQNSWNFPDGEALTFSYASDGKILDKYTLSSVANSLGHVLTFTKGGGPTETEGYTQSAVTVTDETGRAVYVRTKWPSTALSSADATGLKVILPDLSQSLVIYNHLAIGFANAATRVSQVFLPSSHTSPYLTLYYDNLRRASSFVDADGNATTLLPGSVGSLEQSARGVVVDAMGNAAVTYFDWRVTRSSLSIRSAIRQPISMTASGGQSLRPIRRAIRLH